MFSRLFRRPSPGNRAVVDALYGEIVAAARQPVFYADWGVPDTPLGRFEMMSVHMFLLLHRTREASPAVKEVAQQLVDEFFKDVDHSIRELGVSDPGVPKRMKKLSRMFYGRVTSYDAAVDAGDREALAAALARNVVPQAEAWPHGPALAGYILGAAQHLRDVPESALLSVGGPIFPRKASAIYQEDAA